MNNNSGATFAQRVKAVIGMVGSVSEIARRCGFSEGVVRSWRDGHTDPSRARCVTMARTLGISLVWLVAGEGSMDMESVTGRTEGNSRIGERFERSGPRAINSETAGDFGGLDPDRLSNAVKLLSSQMELAGGHFELPRNADLLGELYEILGKSGEAAYADRVVAFHRRLSDVVRGELAAA